MDRRAEGGGAGRLKGPRGRAWRSPGRTAFRRGVFDFIRATPASPRTGEHEITDVLQTIIDSGTPLRPVLFDGAYVNVNTPGDLDTVAAALAGPATAGKAGKAGS